MPYPLLMEEERQDQGMDTSPERVGEGFVEIRHVLLAIWSSQQLGMSFQTLKDQSAARHAFPAFVAQSASRHIHTTFQDESTATSLVFSTFHIYKTSPGNDLSQRFTRKESRFSSNSTTPPTTPLRHYF
ncbi:hypothetical protein RRG08_041402 [Elysia crispata]|uniref:Uncharacterized protein n=1 Tax=Elysia crispata TaxID=231223 RepID=A0AAE0XR47_9GAST|nr:hypothetical protein RRG08_041402 [Elysia crispata]